MIMRVGAFAISSLALGLVSAQGNYSGSGQGSLPVVDLGYQLQQATSYNETGRYYNFTNIRFAAPATGENRWRAPQPPAVNRTGVQNDGETRRACPQAFPTWQQAAFQFLPKYLGGQINFTVEDFDSGTANTTAEEQDRQLEAAIADTTEDCLFLDVVVPDVIFNNSTDDVEDTNGAPVLVWIYGGGYAAGYKTAFSPASLVNRSEENRQDGVVYVAINYRLGAFGFLAGPSLEKNGTANAGLYDQRAALFWIQKHIAKFGGDPNRVTVFGESAGGGSIMHQITAYAGEKGPAPFQQAIPQSPGYQPFVSNQQSEQHANVFLGHLNVSTIEQARQLPSSALQKANILAIAGAPYGQFMYGPTVDGDLVPALPGQLLADGKFDKTVNVMVGHTADEGLFFTSPVITNNSALDQFVLRAFPTLGAWPDVLKYITGTLYPPIFDGSQAAKYTNQIARAAAIISEAWFSCNTFYLNEAYNNKTYSYLFAVPPALHGQDFAFTFYPASGLGADMIIPSVAYALQEYIINFAIRGQPNKAGIPFFNTYGSNATIEALNATGISEQQDPASNYRCRWWQEALYA